LVLRVPAAVIRLENFMPSGADYFVRGFISIRKVREQWEVASDLRVALYKLFREKGVVFPYPKMVLYQNQNKPDDAESFFKFNFDPTVDAHVED
jgi:small-conductance mechanosensitive channel